MKKFLSFLCWALVLSLMLPLCVPVFAADASVISAYYGVDMEAGLLGQVAPGTDEESLLSRLLFQGEASLQGGVKTGSQLTVSGTTLTVVVQGDTNGDGNFSVTDMLKVKSLLLGQDEFSSAQSCAGDVSGDSKVTITDFLQMKSQVLGQTNFILHPIVPLEETLLLTPGQTASFGDTAGTAEILGDAISWASGVITANKLGTAYITCGGLSTLVTVCQEAPTIAFESDSFAIGPGVTAQLKTVTNHPVKQKVTYSVSDETIATVDQNGNVTGHMEGTTTVTATLANGASATQQLTVLPLIDSVSISVPYSMKVKIGGSKQLTAASAPASSPEKLIWASSDTSIATVDQNGLVTGIAAGNVTITCTSEFGKVQASCQLKVCNLVQVAITYDDGPSGKFTPQLLELLRKYDVTATFFLVGEMMSYNQSVVKQIGADGHELGYHTWGHTYFSQMSTQQIKNDFNRFQTMLTELCGRGATLFRAPGGGITKHALNAIQLPHIYWSVDTMDWSTRNTEKVRDAILGGLRDGAIILLHDIHGTTLTGTQAALEYIYSHDLDVEFLTVTQLLSRDGTPPTPGVTYFSAFRSE